MWSVAGAMHCAHGALLLQRNSTLAHTYSNIDALCSDLCATDACSLILSRMPAGYPSPIILSTNAVTFKFHVLTVEFATTRLD